MIIPLSIIPTFVLYAYTMAITPGPANLYSLGTAIQFGRRTALKTWTGLCIGFYIDSTIAVCICYFLGAVLNEYVKYLSLVGAGYLVYLSAKILKSTYADREAAQKEPGIVNGLILNLTNVKIIISCLTELGSFVLPYNTTFLGLFAIGMIIPVFGLSCNLIWLFTGVGLRRLFIKYTKQVNVAMAVSLLYCAVSLVVSVFK